MQTFLNTFLYVLPAVLLIAAIGGVVWYVLTRPATGTTPSAWLNRFLRKTWLYWMGTAVLSLVLFGQPALQAATDYVNGVREHIALPAGTLMRAQQGDAKARAIVADAEQNMTTAEVNSEHQSGGWVPGGTASSKLTAACLALIVMMALIWKMQGNTHPGPTEWAKNGYTADFEKLVGFEKFQAYFYIRLIYAIVAVGALHFASNLL